MRPPRSASCRSSTSAQTRVRSAASIASATASTKPWLISPAPSRKGRGGSGRGGAAAFSTSSIGPSLFARDTRAGVVGAGEAVTMRHEGPTNGPGRTDGDDLHDRLRGRGPGPFPGRRSPERGSSSSPTCGPWRCPASGASPRTSCGRAWPRPASATGTGSTSARPRRAGRRRGPATRRACGGSTASSSRRPARQAALDELAAAAAERPTCLLCFERDPRFCHRRIVAERLAERGFEAVDLSVV